MRNFTPPTDRGAPADVPGGFSKNARAPEENLSHLNHGDGRATRAFENGAYHVLSVTPKVEAQLFRSLSGPIPGPFRSQKEQNCTRGSPRW